MGFYPDNKIDKFQVEYKLYDPEEQILTYHLFFNIIKGVKISTSIFLIQFNKSTANAAVYFKGEILTKLKGKENNFKNIDFDKKEEILDLIKNVCESYKGVELVLSIGNNIGE